MNGYTTHDRERSAWYDDLTLLHLDTGEEVIEHISDLLKEEYGPRTVIVESSPNDALTHVEAGAVDCVISGTELDEMDSLDFLEEVRSIDPDLPFLFYQTTPDEEYITDAISIGASDVIEPKHQTDRTDLLAERIETLVEQYRTQQQLQESYRRFQTLVGNLPGIVYRCRNEPDWPMVFVSEGCSELTGYDADQLVDGDVSYGRDIIAPEDRDRVWDRIQEAVRDGKQYQIDYQIVTAGGSRRWVWEQGEAVYEGDEVWGLEGFVTDISERKEQRRRIEVLNRVIRHNLRNRMSVILSHANQLEDELGDTGQDHTDAIRSTARSVAELSTAVKEIEEIIQTSRDDCHPINVTRTVRNAAERLRNEHPEATIRVESASDLWTNATEQLSLAVRQAIQNGIVHNDRAEPTVTVEARDGDAPETVEVQVRDDGPGIQSMEIDALEDRREITELAHGSGLGLWVMKWFVDTVDGELRIETREPRGTEVTFVLPTAPPPSPH